MGYREPAGNIRCSEGWLFARRKGLRRIDQGLLMTAPQRGQPLPFLPRYLEERLHVLYGDVGLDVLGR